MHRRHASKKSRRRNKSSSENYIKRVQAAREMKYKQNREKAKLIHEASNFLNTAKDKKKVKEMTKHYKHPTVCPNYSKNFGSIINDPEVVEVLAHATAAINKLLDDDVHCKVGGSDDLTTRRSARGATSASSASPRRSSAASSGQSGQSGQSSTAAAAAAAAASPDTNEKAKDTGISIETIVAIVGCLGAVLYVGIKVLDVQDANRVLCDPDSVVAMGRQLIGMVVPNTTNECDRRLEALKLANEELRHAVSNCVSYASGAGGMMLVKKLCAKLGFKKDAATPPPASGRGSTSRRTGRGGGGKRTRSHRRNRRTRRHRHTRHGGRRTKHRR